MGKLLVHRKAYTRRAYTRKDGVHVKESRVPASTFKVKDMGAPGRTPESRQWAKFETVTGWRKTQAPIERRRRLLGSTNGRSSMHDRYVEAGRMINQLANVTTDGPTELKARADANYFFRLAKKTGKV